MGSSHVDLFVGSFFGILISLGFSSIGQHVLLWTQVVCVSGPVEASLFLAQMLVFGLAGVCWEGVGDGL